MCSALPLCLRWSVVAPLPPLSLFPFLSLSKDPNGEKLKPPVIRVVSDLGRTYYSASSSEIQSQPIGQQFDFRLTRGYKGDNPANKFGVNLLGSIKKTLAPWKESYDKPR